MGCCWQDNTFSSSRLFFLSQEEHGNFFNWATDTVNTTIRNFVIARISTSLWSQSSTETEEFSLDQKEFPWNKKTFKGDLAWLAESQKIASCPCCLLRDSLGTGLMLLLVLCSLIWLQLSSTSLLSLSPLSPLRWGTAQGQLDQT